MRSTFKTLLGISLCALLHVVPASAQISTEPNLKVAFFGDQGITVNAVAALQLIKNEQAAMVVHLGDFDYADNPAGWSAQINQTLGTTFPYLSVIGNHDIARWTGTGGYAERIQQRQALIPDATCTGTVGVNMTCTFRGLHIVLSGVGTYGSGHTTYLSNSLAQSRATWKVCAWHKNQRAMQIGEKPDEVGWEPYETCRNAGALIMTGHEHSYERTKTLTNFTNQIVDATCNTPGRICVGPGRTFAVVSGLGGVGVRTQSRCLPTTYPYGCKGEWAKIYTSDQNAQIGILFVTFNVDGNPNKARGYFKTIDNQVVDSFEIYKDVIPPKAPEAFRVSDGGIEKLRNAAERHG